MEEKPPFTWSESPARLIAAERAEAMLLGAIIGAFTVPPHALCPPSRATRAAWPKEDARKAAQRAERAKLNRRQRAARKAQRKE